MSENNQNTNEGKKEKISCLNCKKNHRKCDGGRPCSFCIKKKVECIENQKRKAIGRPKLTEEQKKQKKEENKKKKQEVITLHNKCTNCNATQEVAAKFCNQCGAKLPESLEEKNLGLMKEIELLKQRNQTLQKTIEMKDFNPTHMWMLMRLLIPNDDRFYYPSPAFILESSPAIISLLGYESLSNIYFPDLVPQEQHRVLEKGQMSIEIEKIEGLAQSRVLGRFSNVTLKHKLGHFVGMSVRFMGFIDSITKQPSICISVVEKINNLHIEPEHLPPPSLPTDFKYFCGTTEEPPETLKRFNWKRTPNYLEYTPNHVFSNDQSVNNNDNNTNTYNQANTSYSFHSSILGEMVDIDNLFSNF